MLQIIISLHEGMRASVRSCSEQSSTFSVSNGTKQGCVLAPLLFALFFSAMLEKAFSDLSEGINVEFRTSGGLYNQQRFKARSKISLQLVRDLLFADDAALLAHSLEDIQTIIDKFSETSKAFGLTISMKKTELLYQPAACNPRLVNPSVFIDGKALKIVDTFKYLGSTVTSDGKWTKKSIPE